MHIWVVVGGGGYEREVTKNAAGVEKTGFASEFLIVNLNCFAYLWPHSYTHPPTTNKCTWWMGYIQWICICIVYACPCPSAHPPRRPLSDALTKSLMFIATAFTRWSPWIHNAVSHWTEWLVLGLGMMAHRQCSGRCSNSSSTSGYRGQSSADSILCAMCPHGGVVYISVSIYLSLGIGDHYSSISGP